MRGDRSTGQVPQNGKHPRGSTGEGGREGEEVYVGSKPTSVVRTGDDGSEGLPIVRRSMGCHTVHCTGEISTWGPLGRNSDSRPYDGQNNFGRQGRGPH